MAEITPKYIRTKIEPPEVEEVPTKLSTEELLDFIDDDVEALPESSLADMV